MDARSFPISSLISALGEALMEMECVLQAKLNVSLKFTEDQGDVLPSL
jgi:hypothetical protein